MPLAKPYKLIAFVSNSAWSIYNFRLDVITHLINQGYEVLVLAPDDEYSTLLQQSGCRFIHVDFDNRRKDPLQDFALYRQLKRHYKQQRPDFIFHFVAKPNIYGSLAAASLDIPSVAVITGLGNLGFSNVEDVRVGKNISLQIEAASKEEAQKVAEEASKKLLANPVMEYFEVTVVSQ